MCIKIITDTSLEGLEIKNKLERSTELQGLTNPITIRWGNYIDSIDNGIVLNKAYAIKNTLDKENVLLILRRNKIRAPRRIKPGMKTDFPILGRKYEHNNGTDICIIDNFNDCKKSQCDYYQRYMKFTHEYRIHVMDLEVFYTEEKYTDKYDGIDYEPIIRTKAFGWNFRKTEFDDLNVDKKDEIYKVAIKAIHAMGLDFGSVSIAKAVNDRYYVIDVDSTCQFSSDDCMKAYISQFIYTVLKYNNLLINHNEITIGADPECLLKDTKSGEMICASDFFPSEGPCGLDDRSIEASKKHFPLMELRPNYSVNPIKVYQSIEEIFTNMFQYIHYKNIGLFAGSMPVYGYWLGGHIHFGILPNSKLIKALDNYLALPLMMVEKSNTARERKTTYGVLGNYRLKFHGGFEYCTLSSWLVSPEIALAVLCLAKVVASEYLNLQDEFICNYSDIRSYYLVNKNYYKDKMDRLITSIKKTNSYSEFSKYIEPLFQYVLKAVEWKEEANLKDTWGLSSSNQIYKIPSRCFVPKKLRIELGIKLGQKINVKIGDSEVILKVYPKDDSSCEKSGFISLSYDICEKLGINYDDNLGLYYDNKKKKYEVGPVLGIYADYYPNHLGPFAYQSYYFAKLIKLAKNKGMIVYVFTLKDIDWKLNKVRGYTFDLNYNSWIRKYYPLPQIIYDRGDIITEETFGQYATDYLYNTKKRNIKFINSLECIGTTNNKWITYKLLSSSKALKNNQPMTIEYKHKNDILKFLKKYHHVFLKIKDGSRSKGIFSVKKITHNNYSIQYKDLDETIKNLSSSRKDLIKLIHQKMKEIGCKQNDYIIQEAINFLKYQNQGFEIRSVMQKNSKGKWFRTGMVSRVVGSKGRFLNRLNEEDIKSSTVLLEVFGEDRDLIARKIRSTVKAIVTILDQSGIQAGEIAIDLGIDENRNIYIIELNSKPDNLLSAIGAYRIRNLACNRILEYGKYLVLKEYNK